MATAVNEIFNIDGGIDGTEKLGNVTVRIPAIDGSDFKVYDGSQTTTIITTALSRRYNDRLDSIRMYTGDAAT